jgi:DNA-binding MarR family transcriptional regulator
MSTITSSMPAGCWDLDLSTGMLALCSHSRIMFGLGPDSPDRLTESEWESRFHAEDLAPVREALSASLIHRAPYAVRFRTIHPDGSVREVLGVGRPLEYGARDTRFVGWNFDVRSTGDLAADWISAHPEALSAGHRFSMLPATGQSQEPFAGTSSELLDRAQSILRVRRARERLLGRAVIGEPVFDLLLSLYVRSGQAETSLTSLARPAGVPYSTALRWTCYLADKGLLERTESRTDRRVTCVRLTAYGRAVMDELLSLR